MSKKDGLHIVNRCCVERVAEVKPTLGGAGQLGKICVRGDGGRRCHGPLSHGSIYSIINARTTAKHKQLTLGGRVGAAGPIGALVSRQSLSGPEYLGGSH